jgi:hypothetical protein
LVAPRVGPAQQPNIDVVPGEIMLVLPSAGVVIVDPPTVGHGVEVMLGGITGVIGLMPAFPSSVEPSGIVPLPVAEPAIVPGVGGSVPETVPPDGEVPPQAPDVAEVPFIPFIAPLDVDELACMPLRPPPSKLVPEPETLVPIML